MIVASAKIILDFWGNEDLKNKRKLIETLSEKLERQHRLYLTEVGSFSDLEKCEVAFAFCSSDLEKAQKHMRSLLEFIDKNSAARVVSESPTFQRFED